MKHKHKFYLLGGVMMVSIVLDCIIFLAIPTVGI